MLAPGNYNPPYKYQYTVALATPGIDGTLQQPKEEVTETYATVLEETKKWIDAEAGVVQTILTGIDNDIYSTVDACPHTMEMWKVIERLKQEWQRFVTLVKRSQELKTVSYHKLYDFLKQHQNEVNEIRAKRLARTANPLALVTQQQPVYYPQPNPTHYTQSLSTKSQAATKNKGKAKSNSPPTYDQEPKVVADDEASSKEKEIDKLMALISMYDRLTGQYYNQREVNVTRARENVGTQIQEVIPDAVDNFRPIFDTKPFEKVTDLAVLRWRSIDDSEDGILKKKMKLLKTALNCQGHSYYSTNTSDSISDIRKESKRGRTVFCDLARLQRQEKEANEEAEALRKNLEQETKNLVTQAGAAKSSSTNIFSTVSTTAKASGTNLVNTVSIPVSTASPNKGLSLSDTSNFQEDDS
ncbi:hypothetical protein Tco_0535030 [Tanacetum coccineum]